MPPAQSQDAPDPLTAIAQKLALVRKVGKLFFWVAVVLLVAGMVLLVRAVVFVSTAKQAEAVVTEVESHRDARRRAPGRRFPRVYTPTFRFTDTTGRQHVVRLKVSSSRYDYTVGERVTILYDPAAPEHVRVRSFFGTWGVTLLVLALGLGAGFFACVISAAAKTLEKRPEERAAAGDF